MDLNQDNGVLSEIFKRDIKQIIYLSVYPV